jgi:hypothetical protein
MMNTMIQERESSPQITPELTAIADKSGQTQIRVKGRSQRVPSVQIEGRTIIRSGGWLKRASFHDEDLQEGEAVVDPDQFARRLRNSGINADFFTFVQKIPDTTPRFSYVMEWDNLAAIPITTFSEWWDKRADPGVRRAVRKAAKVGVTVREVQFDDEFVKGIVGINNETPIRQGKPFWHFQKGFEAVKEENSTHAERNIFLGAFLEDELIGFIRITVVDKCAHILQMLTMMKHFDKRPANALIAKAVEVCEQKGLSHLVYCNYVYNDPASSLTEFKRRNGFEKVLLPRYYIPLSLKGKLAVSFGLHRGLAKNIPQPILLKLLRLRSHWYERKAAAMEGSL